MELITRKPKEKGMFSMVRDYFTAQYVAESLDISLVKARHKLADERRFTKIELKSLEASSGIDVKYMLAGTEIQGSQDVAFAEELTD